MLKGKEYLSFVLVMLVVIGGSDACFGGSSGGSSRRRTTTPKPRPTCPTIYSRSSWRARSPNTTPSSIRTPPYVFIHHSDTPACSTPSACKARIRSIQNYHMDTNRWSDIGYSFLVGEDGNIYEGRGWGKEGAHTRGYNDEGIGICIIGNFNNRAPNPAALDAVKSLIACGVERGHIQSDYTLRGHRDMGSTDCPGDRLYSIIRGWPHY